MTGYHVSNQPIDKENEILGYAAGRIHCKTYEWDLQRMIKS